MKINNKKWCIKYKTIINKIIINSFKLKIIIIIIIINKNKIKLKKKNNNNNKKEKKRIKDNKIKRERQLGRVVKAAPC